MLIPTRENIEKLFETHQNQCAFVKCKKKIIDDDGIIGGNILFIESNIKEKPRFNPELTDDEMINYHNLILVCYKHAFDVEFKEKKYTMSKLRNEIFEDSMKWTDKKGSISNKNMEEIIFHFLQHHDPDRLSHLTISTPDAIGGMYHSSPIYEVTCTGVKIAPTKHLIGGKFEIIMTKGKLLESDKVVFYSKNSEYSQGVQAHIEIKSQTRIEGKVPNLPTGEYFVSLRSSIDETSRLENDLIFTVL